MASSETWQIVETAKKEIRFNERMADLTVERYRNCGAIDRRSQNGFRDAMLDEISGPVNQKIADAVESADIRIFHEDYETENGVSVITTGGREHQLIRELLTRLISDFAPNKRLSKKWVRHKLNSVDSILRQSRSQFAL